MFLSEIINMNDPGPGTNLEPLYHATLRVNEQQIMREGLRPTGVCKLFGWCTDYGVYLTNYPDIAQSFVDPGVIEPHTDDEQRIHDLLEKKGGIVLTISQDNLNKKNLQPDPHYTADEDEGTFSYLYKGTIPPSAIIGKKYFKV